MSRKLGTATDDNFDNSKMTLNSRFVFGNEDDTNFYSGDINKIVEEINPVVQLEGTDQVDGLDDALDSKLNLAGGTMTGDLILNVDATQPMQATTLQQVNAGLALKLNLAGGTLTGDLILNGDASQALQPVTFQQFQAMVAGLSYKNACRVATTASLTATYSNGSSGVGATLTNSGAQAALTIDSTALSLNDRVLVKNQASQLQNGIYIVSNVGSVSTNWVLTRATDYDTTAEITAGSYTNIVTGTVNAGILYFQSTPGTITVGTTAIAFTILAIIIAGTGLVLTAPNTLSINFASGAEAIAGTVTDKPVAPDTLKAKLGNQTNHGVLVGAGQTAALTALTVGTNGQVLVGATGADPAFATMTSSGGTLTYTAGANTLNIDGTDATTTQKGVMALATNAEAIAGSVTNKAVTPDDLKAKLGTQTNHGLLVGAGQTAAVTALAVGSTGQLVMGNTGADPSFTTATYPSTTTANRILASSANNTVSEITSANNGVLITSGAGVPSISSTLPSAVQSNITSTGTLGSLTVTGNINNTALTASRVVVSDGSKNLASAAYSAVGTWVLIQTQIAANSTSIDFTTGLGAYDLLRFDYIGVRPAVAGNVLLQMLVSNNGGSSYITSNYKSGLQVFSFNSATPSNSNLTTAMQISGNYTTTTGEFGSGHVYIAKLASLNFNAWGDALLFSSTAPFREFFQGTNTANSDCNAVRFNFSGGSAQIAQGTFSVYGLVQ